MKRKRFIVIVVATFFLTIPSLVGYRHMIANKIARALALGARDDVILGGSNLTNFVLMAIIINFSLSI